jgi:hypothetical protein
LIAKIAEGFGLARNNDLLGVAHPFVVNASRIARAYRLNLPALVYGDLMFDRVLLLLA